MSSQKIIMRQWAWPEEPGFNYEAVGPGLRSQECIGRQWVLASGARICLHGGGARLEETDTKHEVSGPGLRRQVLFTWRPAGPGLRREKLIMSYEVVCPGLRTQEL